MALEGGIESYRQVGPGWSWLCPWSYFLPWSLPILPFCFLLLRHEEQSLPYLLPPWLSDHKGPSDHGLKPWAKGNPPSWVVSVRDLVTAKRKGTNWGSTSNLCSVYTAVGDNLFLCSWLDLPELFLFIYLFFQNYLLRSLFFFFLSPWNSIGSCKWI